MSKYRYAVKVRKAGRYVWRWDCPACGRWEASSSVRKARRPRPQAGQSQRHTEGPTLRTFTA